MASTSTLTGNDTSRRDKATRRFLALSCRTLAFSWATAQWFSGVWTTRTLAPSSGWTSPARHPGGVFRRFSLTTRPARVLSILSRGSRPTALSLRCV